MCKLIFLVVVTYITSISTIASAKTILGAYILDNGYSPANMTAFKTDINKDLGIIHIFTSFDYDWNTLRVQNTNIMAQGATSMITLEPTLAQRQNDNLLPEIIAGDWDGYLDQWIADFKIWIEELDDPDARVLLRFAHEFNGIWYPWSNDPENYILAWRYVHNRFEAADANQYVEWVWNANSVDVDDYNDITLYYPGDDVVDWTSIDGYNWGSNFSFTRWNTFAELFEEKYALLMLHYPNHPILIAEVASAEPSDVPNSLLGQDGDDSDRTENKGRWITEMFKQLRSQFHGIKGLVWFNINKELSWSINEAEHNTGVAKFKKVVNRQYVKSEFRSADAYTRHGKLIGAGHHVQTHAAGFHQLPKSFIEQRRRQHHQMLADKAQK
ncbi:glycoside hydrolase family 26 protein [Shewanella surugensis]|uniref:GH26 domain-containing protein n=1 Tax=Shewanella surugensis TaxID=212020 RepID=A0ABT0LGU1_9GAMM|nr:glycosyl hydrolase [Shewanella surugensis]MCL1126774.1 hypothetical protein [Shewanella surugensis]